MSGMNHRNNFNVMSTTVEASFLNIGIKNLLTALKVTVLIT